MSLTELSLDGKMFLKLKPEVFPDIPFPSPEFSQNPFESVNVPVRWYELSRIFLFSRRELFQDL
jgi:hypothetical protein